MDDLSRLFSAQEKVARWRAEYENAGAQFYLARIEENCANILSQYEPLASIGLDRNKLRHVLNYIYHGDVDRLNREIKKI